ncbi:hypothetical protein ASF29_13325 [Rhizobium sp. Leaf262]|nr:hypothetical protein ASF29_13325 [Rhizobium sp. Leaf262]
MRRSKGVGAISRGALLASTVLLTMPHLAMAQTYDTTGNVIPDGTSFSTNVFVGQADGAIADIIVNSGTLTSPYGDIAWGINSIGTATVTGDGSVWTNTGYLNVGVTGTGTLNIEAGGQVTNASGFIGDKNSSVGTVNVTGEASSWTNSDDLIVGNSGAGTLNIEAGAHVGSATSYIGSRTVGNGTVNVTGQDATWANSGNLFLGSSGTGTLTIADGGVVSVGTEQPESGFNGTVFIADQTGSSGTLNIGGAFVETAGTAGTLNAAAVQFGAGTGQIFFNHSNEVYDFSADIIGKGDIFHMSGVTTLSGNSSGFTGLTYIDGGKLHVTGSLGGQDGSIGHQSDSTGQVVVSGAGSTWSNSGGLIVGTHGSGTLTVANGGVVSVGTMQPNSGHDGTLTIANQTGSTGTLIIGAAADEDAAAAGTLEAAGVSFGAGTGKIVFNHTNGGYEFSSDISGNGTINHIHGNTKFTGDNTQFTGTTNVEGGTLHVVDVLSGTTNVNGGELDVTGQLRGGLNITAGEVTVSGTGSIETEGSITIGSNSNSNISTGLVVGGRGEIPVAPGSVTAQSIDLVGPNSFILFNHADQNYDFDTPITGNGTIAHLAGVTTLSGNNNDFSGTTYAYGGTLVVTEALGGQVSVYGGTLAGTGHVGETTVKAGGILSPGLVSAMEMRRDSGSSSNSYKIGTLHVDGNLTFNAGSTYAVDLSSEPSDDVIDNANSSKIVSKSDRVIVNGNVTINDGAKLKVTALDEDTSYKTAKNYRIIETLNHSLTGEFTDIDKTNSPFLNVTTTYENNNAYLTVKTSDFVSVAKNPNQRSLGAALDSLDQSGESLKLYNSLAVLDESQVQKTYEQLSGEVYATAQGAFTQTNRAVNTALNSRVRSVTDGVAAPSSLALGYAEEEKGPVKDDRFAAYENKKSFDTDRFATWVNGFGSWGKVSGVDGSSDTDVSNGGVLVGGDVGFGENTRVGVLGGYSRSFFSTDSSSGNSTNYHVGTYAGTKIGAVSLRTGANYTWHDVDTMRSITALGQSLYGDYDGSSFNIYGELAYRIEAGKSAFEPFAALAYSRTKTDGFTETGGPAALTVESSAMNTTYTTMGLRASSDFEVGGVASVARGTLGWQHAFGDIDPVSTARFATGDSFSTSSTPIDRNTALLEAGLDFTVTPSSTVSVSYNGQIGSNAYDHGMNAKFRLKF